MKKKLFIIVLIILFILGVIGFCIWNNRTISIISLDINPSIQIRLNRHDKVKKVVALNEDAKDIVKNTKDENIGRTLENITKNIIKSNFVDESRFVDIILYTDGKISSEDVRGKLVDVLDQEQCVFNIIVVKEITKEDKKLAKKYNISPAKAAYIRSITDEKEGIDSKDLVHKSVSELNHTKETGYYCEEDYILEGSWCLKEKKRETAPKGDICPNGYGDYQGVCYEEEAGRDGDKLICREDFTLVGKKCERHSEHDARGKCSSGDYDSGLDKCVARKYVGDAVEYCRITPGEDLLYNGRCLGRKPTINGGCLGSDVVIDGWCYDTSPTSGYEAEWKCEIDGEMILMHKSNSDGKCYRVEESDPTSYYCDDHGKLVDKKCILEDKEDAMYEKICSSGYTLLNGRCYNLNKTSDMVKGFYCDEPDTRLVGNTCIYYERKDAKQG